MLNAQIIYSKLLDHLISKTLEERNDPWTIKNYSQTLLSMVLKVYNSQIQDVNIRINQNVSHGHFEDENEFLDSILYRYALVENFSDNLMAVQPINDCEKKIITFFKLNSEEKFLVDHYTTFGTGISVNPVN